MKILVVNANTNETLTNTMVDAAKQIAAETTEIYGATPDRGIESIEGNFDISIAVDSTRELVLKNLSFYDSFVIGCYSDPGLFALREITDKNIFGIAESSMAAALMLGHKFGILTPLYRIKPIIENLVVQYGFERKCASIETVEIDVSDTFRNRDRVLKEYRNRAIDSLHKGAEVIILGGAVFSGISDILQKDLKVPVLEGLACAVKYAEFYSGLNKNTSKYAFYRFPKPKGIHTDNPLIESMYNKNER